MESNSAQPSTNVDDNEVEQAENTKKAESCKKGKEFMAYESQTVIVAGKSQLDLYLEEPKLEFAFHENMNVLEYWKSQKQKYPILARMACDVLAIPITTVASESSFSIGARVLNKYRSCILPKKVQYLICARNWLHGYETNDNEDEADAIVKTSLPSEGSNNVQVIED